MPFQILAQTSQEPTTLEQAIIFLQKLGFFQIVVPFVLIFSVIFAILEKSKLLGEERRAINAVVALVIALLTTGALSITGIINKMIPLVVLAIVILLLFFLIYGLFGGEIVQVGLPMKIGLGIASGIAVALIFLYSANLFQYLSGEIIGIVLFIAVIIAVIGVVVGVSPKSEK